MKAAAQTSAENALGDARARPPAELFRMLPAVHELYEATEKTGDTPHARERRVAAIRRVLDALRKEIDRGVHAEETLRVAIEQLPDVIEGEMQRHIDRSLRRVINATGVILHTNLGRAPLSRNAVENISAVAGGYSNLEFDLEGGGRGRREDHVEARLLELLEQNTGGGLKSTHGVLVVNNCAAATFLALHALARDRQVIVSRSELVEIGGGFRIPDILEQSGAVLREVGTTNRTRVADYARAVSPETGLILRVHQSNFAMEGFVERPTLSDLVQLGARTGTPVFDDQGTGLISASESHSIDREPTLPASVAAGCGVVAASGDKLLGGPQCGILVGRREHIDRMREDPLYRVLRVDKLSYAALEATLIDYLEGDPKLIPVLRMLQIDETDILHRCEAILSKVHGDAMVAAVTGVTSLVGGGTLPRSRLPSYAIALRHSHLDANELLTHLRRLEVPVVGRIESDRVLLDLRTVDPEFDHLLRASLQQLAETPAQTWDMARG